MTNTKYIVPVKDDKIACVQIDTSNYNIKPIDKKSYRESGSPFGRLNLYHGTVVFENTIHNIYGIIPRSEYNKLRIVFVRAEIIKDDNTVNYLNINGPKVNINNIPLENLEKYFTNISPIKTIRYSNNAKFTPLITLDNFISEVTKTDRKQSKRIAETSDKNIIETKVENKEAKTEEIKETKIINNTNSNNNITSELINEICRNTISEFLEQSKSVNKRDEMLLLKEKELKEKEKEIQDKLKELNESIEKNKELKETLVEAIAIARENTVNKISEQLIGVSDIIELDENTLNNKDTADTILYESMIKAVKPGDVISIPKKVYSRLSTLLKKNLYMNLEYTVYKAIVEIRFETKSINFMLAVVDYDEELEFVRLTVMKPFNEEFVTPSQMIDYELKYNEWHKRNSFINS